MDIDEKRNLDKLIEQLADGFARMGKTFKRMTPEDIGDGFATLGKLTRHMEAALQQYRTTLGVADKLEEE